MLSQYLSLASEAFRVRRVELLHPRGSDQTLDSIRHTFGLNLEQRD
jgi:hypothetical protein